VCVRSARTDLCGGRQATGIPTATQLVMFFRRRLSTGIPVSPRPTFLFAAWRLAAPSRGFGCRARPQARLYPSVEPSSSPRLGPRSGQSCFRAGLACRMPNSGYGGRCSSVWRERKKFQRRPGSESTRLALVERGWQAKAPAPQLARTLPKCRNSSSRPRVRPTIAAGPRYIYIPPFTASTWPVMYEASSLARNLTAAAISSGVPMRASGILAMMVCFNSSGKSLVMSVET
jgi:hypothetical protein